MIIKRISVKGENKPVAQIDLQKGLNVISGASNTGKSYIVECINFILGAETPPKEIDQANGYSSLEVIFEENGKTFTLKRELKDNADIVLTQEEEGQEGTSILKPSHKGKKNLSNFFLEKINLNNKTLVSGLKNFSHSSLTLRILEKIFIVDEKRIIDNTSPLGKGQYSDVTLEKSLLKTLLTANDDSAVLVLKEKSKTKGAITSEIAHLETFMEQYFPLKNSQYSDTNIEDLESTLAKTLNAINRHEEELGQKIAISTFNTEKRKELSIRFQKLMDNINNNKILHNRFSLLLDKYASDKERLEAISEAALCVNNHYTSLCPTCGKEISEEDNILETETIITSNHAEVSKINLKAEELKLTLNDIEKIHSNLSEDIRTTQEEINKLDKIIIPKSNEITSHRNTIKELTRTEYNIQKTIDTKENRNKILQEIEALQTAASKTQNKYIIDDFSKETDALMNEIESILKRWDFLRAKKISYDEENRDIIIGESPRKNFGKGYRAIYFSAFIIGLMTYLFKENRHPGFVVIDSPLTTYKEQDKIPDNEAEEQSDVKDIIYAFYRDLCESYKDTQIIILDNQEPTDDLLPLMNYIHFSRNHSVGRYGFFP